MFSLFKKRAKVEKGGTLAPPVDRGGWLTIFEWFPGAFQQDVKVNRDLVLSYHAVFSCITLISSDISKMCVNLVQQLGGIWREMENSKYKVLIKPNGFQNRIQFFESWLNSKLSRGNTYILKERASDGSVARMYVLNPDLVTPLVSDTGDVFYRLQKDNLAAIEDQVIVPATEIIHDRFNCLYHPLVGLSPIFASGVAATQGNNIQKNSAVFFENMSRPSGILTAPGEIPPDKAKVLKDRWETNYGGQNIGKVAVLGNDLKYQAVTVNAVDAQLIEQLGMTSDIVCSTFHVPKYKVIGDPPSYNNIEALEQQYYSQCLQVLIEAIELCLDEGLEMPSGMGTEFDIEGLLRMDTATKIKTLAAGVSGGIYTPNEARFAQNKPPIQGGDTVYLQQQMFSLAALAKRDASDDPFGKSSAGTAATPAADPDAAQEESETMAAAAAEFFRKRLEIAR